MKGIVLAGGSGTRLYPLTSSISKQLLPIYNKPTIYYPLSILMLAGIRDILVISTPTDLPKIQELLGSGEQFGITLQYKIQETPSGIAQALIIGEEFLNGSPVCLILGDNLFFGTELPALLERAAKHLAGACIFGYQVKDPENYGVVEFDGMGKVLSLEEKPASPKSKWAVPGIYFYDSRASAIAKKLKPSARGELEITDLNIEYLKSKELRVELLGRGIAWLDTGTADSLLAASQFVQTIEKRQGLQIACLEEIALNKKFLTSAALQKFVQNYPQSDYGKYVKGLTSQ